MPSSDQYQNEALGGQQFTPNNVWGSSPIQGAEEELTLPSGQTCRARRMTIESVISTGLASQVDILTAVVDKHTRDIKGGNKVPDGPAIDHSILKDQEALSTIIGLADQLMPHIVISPKVYLHFADVMVGKTSVRKMIPVEGREAGRIYTDMIALDDKMHLFQWAMGGLEEFSSFRREAPGNVGAVEPRKRAKGKAKRSPRDS